MSTMQANGPDRSVSRRKVIAGSMTLMVPSALSVNVDGQEDGDQAVMLEVDADVPSGTEIEIAAHERHGSFYNTNRFDIEDGETTQEVTIMDGTGDEYWIDVEMETENQDISPELFEVTLRITDPVPSDDEIGLYRLWDNFMVWITTAVMAFLAVGLASRSMAVASMGAYLIFAYIAMQTGVPLLENILYVSLVVVFVGMAFKLWRLEGGGTGPQ